jgi:hypothetical protein
MVNKKLAILFLVMCIMGFSMSPVNAAHVIQGKVGDIFDFTEDSDINNDLSSAYMESGLFDVHQFSKFDDEGNVIYYYVFKAVDDGWKLVEINCRYYIFDIERN